MRKDLAKVATHIFYGGHTDSADCCDVCADTDLRCERTAARLGRGVSRRRIAPRKPAHPLLSMQQSSRVILSLVYFQIGIQLVCVMALADEGRPLVIWWLLQRI